MGRSKRQEPATKEDLITAVSLMQDVAHMATPITSSRKDDVLRHLRDFKRRLLK